MIAEFISLSEVSFDDSKVRSTTETLGVEYSGEVVEICFNAQYVLDFLSAVDTDTVELEFKDEMSQAVMKPIGASGDAAEACDYTYVIMPMGV